MQEGLNTFLLKDNNNNLLSKHKLSVYQCSMSRSRACWLKPETVRSSPIRLYMTLILVTRRWFYDYSNKLSNLPYYRAGDHVTFVYGNSWLRPWFKRHLLFFEIRLIYIDHVPGNKIPIPSIYNFPLLLFYFSSYACTNILIQYFLYK